MFGPDFGSYLSQTVGLEGPKPAQNYYKINYRIVASTNTCYYSENQLFVQRSLYIRTENPLHKQSEKAKTCH